MKYYRADVLSDDYGIVPKGWKMILSEDDI